MSDDDAPRAEDDDRAAPVGGGWPLAGAAVIVGALVGAAWFAIQSPPGAATPAVATVPQPAPAAASLPAGDIARLLHTDPPAAPPLPEPAAHEALVCGHLVPRADLAADRLTTALREAGAADAVREFARRLTDDDHARAVGLVLTLHAEAATPPATPPATSPAASPASAQPPCRDDACRARETAMAATAVASAERAMPLLTQLATLAATSRDPRVTVLAQQQCARLGDAAPPLPHCQAPTARQRVAIDGDNGWAWLALAAAEPGAVDEAMHRASIAPRWDDHALAPRRFVERVDPRGGLRSLAVLQALAATPAVQSTLELERLKTHCDGARTAADANRRQQCERIALGLREHAASLHGLTTAARLADAVGHPDAAAWRDEARLLAFVERTEADDPQARDDAARDCSTGLPRDLLLRSARDGELPVLRALMQASTQTAAQWRERLAAADAAEAARQAAAATQKVAAATVPDPQPR